MSFDPLLRKVLRRIPLTGDLSIMRTRPTAPEALIGFGAIAQTLVGVLCDAGFAGPLVVLVRPDKQAKAQGVLEGIAAGRCTSVQCVTSVEDLLKAGPQVVVECAGHSAVAQFGPAVVSHGTDLIIASVGALADDALFDGLKAAADESGAQVTVPAGAIGGIDALAAARIAGVARVVYVGRKPPQAWVGSPAEDRVDLGALTSPTVFFEGTARQAAAAFPKNANVAATLALAGLGMDLTEVQLLADPNVSDNAHEYRVTSAVVDYTMVLTGKPSALNPKTSQSTVYSLARAVLTRSDVVVI